MLHKSSSMTSLSTLHKTHVRVSSIKHMAAQQCLCYADEDMVQYLVTQCAFHSRYDFTGISRQLQPVLHCSSIQVAFDGRGGIVCCLRQRKDWQISMTLSDCPHYLMQAQRDLNAHAQQKKWIMHFAIQQLSKDMYIA